MISSKLSQFLPRRRRGLRNEHRHSHGSAHDSQPAETYEATIPDDVSEVCERCLQQHPRSESCPDNITARQCMPLALVAPGDTVAVYDVQGGRKLRQRLLDLGLNQGAKVRVLKNDIPGPLIVAVKEDGRLALGRSMTQKILVTQIRAER